MPATTVAVTVGSAVFPGRATMAKKKKATLYVDIDEKTKQIMDKVAEIRHRKLNAEVELALKQYIASDAVQSDLASAEEGD
jgi:hypothetical protein